MKKSSVSVAVLMLVLAAGSASAQEQFTPSPQQAASIAYICKSWRSIAHDVFAMKEAGKAKPKGTTVLHTRIIDDIYYEKSSITSAAMAEEMAEHLCVPIIREKFRTGEMRIKGDKPAGVILSNR